MSTGMMFRSGFESLFHQFSGPIVIYRDYGKTTQSERRVSAMKNTKSKRSEKVIFQFLERQDIGVGDILQEEGSRDIWRVEDTSDQVITGVFQNFEVDVSRATAQGMPRPNPKGSNNTLTFNGPVFGAVQVASPNAVQDTHVIVNQDADKILTALRTAIANSDLTALDKEDVAHALDRVGQLANREQTPETKMVTHHPSARVSMGSGGSLPV